MTTRTLSMFLACTPHEGATRSVDSRTRSAEKVGKKDRIRYKMAWRDLTCALCDRPGSWLVPDGHPARLTFGHIVPLVRYGATNVANLTPQHAECNGAAAERDLRGMVLYSVDALPSLKSAQEWEASGGLLYSEPASLPTVAAMRQGRAGRGLPF